VISPGRCRGACAHRFFTSTSAVRCRFPALALATVIRIDTQVVGSETGRPLELLSVEIDVQTRLQLVVLVALGIDESVGVARQHQTIVAGAARIGLAKYGLNFGCEVVERHQDETPLVALLVATRAAREICAQPPGPELSFENWGLRRPGYCRFRRSRVGSWRCRVSEGKAGLAFSPESRSPQTGCAGGAQSIFSMSLSFQLLSKKASVGP
jgi:hypothetical protein